MSRISRRSLVVGLAASSLAAPLMASAQSVSAQAPIPDGVFVRESNGAMWMIVRGQRVAVPVWTAADADIAAVPDSGLWAVLSVNDDGAIVAGGRPAWLPTQTEPAPSIAQRPAVAAPTSTPTPAPAPAPASGALGEPAILTSNDGVRIAVTAHRVRDNVKSTNQFTKPKGRFVVVEWSVKNEGQKDFDLRVGNLKLTTVDDFVVEREYAAGLPEPDLDSGVIGPGQTVRGFLPYDVPEGQKLKSAIYHGSGSRQLLIADLTR